MLRNQLLWAIVGMVTACGGKQVHMLTPVAGHAVEKPVTTAPVSTVDPIVARLNGTPIAQSEVDRTIGHLRLDELEHKPDADERAYLLAKERLAYLNDLIDQRLMAAAALRAGITVTASEIDEALESIRTAQQLTEADLAQRLEAAGYTTATYRDELRQQLLVQRYTKAQQKPGESTLDATLEIIAAERRASKVEIALVVPPKPAVLTQQLDISAMLDAGDVKDALKHDVPAYTTDHMDGSTQYADAIHFKAVDKGETFDIAVRVWRGSAAIRDDAWQSFLTLPNVVMDPKPLATASFAAHDPDIRVYGYGFRDDPQQTVVLVTCGEDVCKSAAETLAIARLAHTRLTRITIKKL